MPTAAFAHPTRNVEALNVAPGSMVADFGAGSGHYTMLFAREVGAEGKVYAIDVQADLLRRIQNEARHKGYDQVHIVHGDIARPHGAKLRNRTIDLVLISNTLFQLVDPEAAFEEARRILKHGGRLVVIDWADSFRSLGPAKQHVYTREKALHDARASHFEYLAQFDAGAHHYGLVFQPL